MHFNLSMVLHLKGGKKKGMWGEKEHVGKKMEGDALPLTPLMQLLTIKRTIGYSEIQHVRAGE